MSILKVGKIIYLYVVTLELAISSIPVKDIGRRQHPIHYLSKILVDAKIRYTKIEKYIFALLKLYRHYFHAHPIPVITNVPFEGILAKGASLGKLSI